MKAEKKIYKKVKCAVGDTGSDALDMWSVEWEVKKQLKLLLFK